MSACILLSVSQMTAAKAGVSSLGVYGVRGGVAAFLVLSAPGRLAGGWFHIDCWEKSVIGLIINLDCAVLCNKLCY